MKIICVARNYAEHAREMNNPFPEEPVIFLKPDTALLPDGFPFLLPDFSNEIHYETEIVLKFGKGGKNISEKEALSYLSHFTVGIDFTARDIQRDCKEKGLPWEKAKSFDQSAVVGKWIPLEKVSSIYDIVFHLSINGQKVQSGRTSKMIYKVEYLIAHLSKYFTIMEGDILFTGTPKGVGAVKSGDVLEGYVNSERLFTCVVK